MCPWVESQGLWMCQWVGSQWWEHQSPQVVQLSLKQLDQSVDLKLVTSLLIMPCIHGRVTFRNTNYTFSVSKYVISILYR